MCDPIVFGVEEKVTVKVAELPGAIGDAGVSVPKVNLLLPVMVMLLIVKFVVPKLLIVKVRTRLVFFITLPKSV